MPQVVSLAGQKISLSIPPDLLPLLSSLCDPFRIIESDTPDAFFSITSQPIPSPEKEPVLRGNINFREYDPFTFSYSNKEFELNIYLDRKMATLSLEPSATNTSAILFSSLKWFLTIITILNDGLPLHSSLISYRGNGILFSGISGKGKSTISALLSEVLPGVIRGSDELNIIFPHSQKFIAFPTPVYSSGGKSQHTEPIELDDIFFLEQASDNYIEYLSGKERVKYILRNIYHIPGNAYLSDILLDTVTRYSQSSAFKRLYFKNDPSIGSFIKQTADAHYELTTE